MKAKPAARKKKHPFTEEVRKVLLRWRRRLLLAEWTIDPIFMKKDLQDTDGLGPCLAEISSDPVYLRATIRIFPCWSYQTKDRREEALIHELCHCHTQPIRDLLNESRMGKAIRREEVRDCIELLTQRIANAVQWRDR